MEKADAFASTAQTQALKIWTQAQYTYGAAEKEQLQKEATKLREQIEKYISEKEGSPC